MTAAPTTQTDLKSALVELRASVAANGVRKGVAGAIQEAILGFLTVLLMMLEDFRAGRLGRIAPEAEPAGDGGDGAVACPSPSRSHKGRGKMAAAAGDEAATAWDSSWEEEEMWAEACPQPSRIGPDFCEQEREPVAGRFLLLKRGGIRRIARIHDRDIARDGGMRAAFAALCRPTAQWRPPPRGDFSKMRLRANGLARGNRSKVKTMPQWPGTVVYFPKLYMH